MSAPLCGQPTVNGRPCRRRLLPFGPRMMCPAHPTAASTVHARPARRRGLAAEQRLNHRLDFENGMIEPNAGGAA
jgi:hypothetical protein